MTFAKEILLIAVFFLSSGRLLLAAETHRVDFAHEIVPILKAHCVDCHGGDKAKGGFSLNSRRLFLEGEAAVPGQADERPLVAVENPVTITDLHATIMTAMGISPKTEFTVEERPFYVTEDGKGAPVTEIFS